MSTLTDEEILRLRSLLPPPPPPAANYVPVREHAGLLYVAGQTPHISGILEKRGAIGAEISEEEGYALARIAALNVVAALQHYLGDLRHVKGILSITGFVASAPGFTHHPQVLNGASDTLIECFGEAGRHSRAAVGVQSLPDGASVEVSVIACRRELND